MPNKSDPDYFAQYQRKKRAEARKAGVAQLCCLVPGELVGRLDAMKRARGLRSQNEALAAVLREYFAQDPEQQGTSP